MPLLDRRSDSIVLRIVYDGLPEAGKTTNLRRLCERISLNRRSELATPGGGQGERTEYFDWLDVAGGYVVGRRVRCQLVTVPGQPERLRRRRRLLGTADAVVLVADSRHPEGERLRALLDDLRAQLDCGLVLQANKQDLPGALDPARLRGALGLPDEVTALGAQAEEGVGVLETFMLAVRLAVDRVRTLLLAGELAEGEAETAHELLARLVDGEASQALDHLVERAGSLVDAGAPVLPAVDAPPGWVWPPQAGRAVLRALHDAPLEWQARCLSREALDGEGARAALREQIALHQGLGELLPEPRALALACDARRRHFLWQITPRRRSLAEVASEAAPDRLAGLVDAALALVARAPALAPLATQLEVDDALVEVRLAHALVASAAPLPLDARVAALVESLALDEPPARALARAFEAAGDARAELSLAARLLRERAGPDPVPVPPLPGVDVPAGMVWPLVRGRATLAGLGGEPRLRLARAWSPADAIELECGEEWLAHTRPAWSYADLDVARLALMEAVRRQGRCLEIMPEGRTLALAPAGRGARLWQITPLQPSFAERWRAARGGAPDARLAILCAGVAALARVQAALVRAGMELEPGLDDVGGSEERPALLWIFDPEVAAVPARPPLERELAALLASSPECARAAVERGALLPRPIRAALATLCP